MSREKELMIKFLEANYPIRRIKHDMRFKRTIINEYGEEFYLSDKNQSKLLYYKLLSTLKLVFYTPEIVNKDVLKTFLRMK